MSGRCLVILVATIALGACGCSKSETKSDSSAAPPVTGGGSSSASASASASETGAVQTGSDDSFNLAVTSPDPGAAGAQLVAQLTVTPGKGYHINQDFKPKLTLTPPDGVTLAKNELATADAATSSDHELTFKVQATAKAAGSYTVPGKLKFAVCTDDLSDCEPKQRAVSFTVTAK